jgi:ABC-type transport system involved in multi-copper enzyme maturation permease subunit
MKALNLIGTEFAKLRRSRVTWVTLAFYTFMVAVAGFLVWLMLNPEVGKSLGLISQKANFTLGGAKLDWPTFLTLIMEMGGVGGLIICSVIMAYVFGREYAEGTAKNMLALPIPRSGFAFAKIAVSAVWFLILTLWMIAETYIVGSMLALGGFTAALFTATAERLLALALMSVCSSVLVAWIAVETRGYFAPLGFAIFTMMLASLFGHTGWGPWVPWSIIGLYSGAAGPEAGLGWGSYAVIAATFVVGTALVIRHEAYADNGQ